MAAGDGNNTGSGCGCDRQAGILVDRGGERCCELCDGGSGLCGETHLLTGNPEAKDKSLRDRAGKCDGAAGLYRVFIVSDRHDEEALGLIGLAERLHLFGANRTDTKQRLTFGVANDFRDGAGLQGAGCKPQTDDQVLHRIIEDTEIAIVRLDLKIGAGRAPVGRDFVKTKSAMIIYLRSGLAGRVVVGVAVSAGRHWRGWSFDANLDQIAVRDAAAYIKSDGDRRAAFRPVTAIFHGHGAAGCELQLFSSMAFLGVDGVGDDRFFRIIRDPVIPSDLRSSAVLIWKAESGDVKRTSKSIWASTVASSAHPSA